MQSRLVNDYTGKVNGAEKESARHEPSGVLLN
jgi:hypothetical protein